MYETQSKFDQAEEGGLNESAHKFAGNMFTIMMSYVGLVASINEEMSVLSCWKIKVKSLNSFVNMTRNTMLKIQLFCGTSESQV